MPLFDKSCKLQLEPRAYELLMCYLLFAFCCTCSEMQECGLFFVITATYVVFHPRQNLLHIVSVRRTYSVVGRLQTREEDLQKYFCQFGVVRDTKIIRDRAEVSKGYLRDT